MCACSRCHGAQCARLEVSREVPKTVCTLATSTASICRAGGDFMTTAKVPPVSRWKRSLQERQVSARYSYVVGPSTSSSQAQLTSQFCSWTSVMHSVHASAIAVDSITLASILLSASEEIFRVSEFEQGTFLQRPSGAKSCRQTESYAHAF